MSGTAVVLVDVQRDFLDVNTGSTVASWPKTYCVPGIYRLLAHARQQHWRVIHVGTRHRTEATLPTLHKLHGLSVYCQEGTAGADFVVTPEPGDVVLFKTWYSAFTPDLARQLEGGQVIVWGGVATDCCIQQSAFDADRQGLRSVVPIQAVSASKVGGFVPSLVALAKSAATIVDLDDLTAARTIPERGLELDDIEERARKWFDEQESRLGDPSGLQLDAVLRRLGADAE
jgi:nicotinamidase-related amidase